ncbi:MAG: alpha-L-fucosidase [Chitinophagaceae bacterium]
MKVNIKYAYYTLLTGFILSNQKTIAQNADKETVKVEHGMINIAMGTHSESTHSIHPDAQWYPDAGLGLFIHWGLSSVKDMGISWPMIPGRPLAVQVLNPDQIKRVVAEKDYNLNGIKPRITPNEYWAMAEDFNPKNYNPEKWIKAAKDAGFTYAVLTTKHHEGFAMWPSAFGDFSTKNFMNGEDLISPFIKACRKYGLKVGLYYSPPDWHFDRDYMSFLYYKVQSINPSFPKIDADLNARMVTHSEEEIKEHNKEYAALVKGQVEELLTRYGKIDLLWFDGTAPIANGRNLITQEEIHKLQPGIVMNPRMHGKGDFITYERDLPKEDPGNVWSEFCNTWTNSWTYERSQPFRSNAFILGQFVSVKAMKINYLLGIGPNKDGELRDSAYINMKVIERWMVQNGKSVKMVQRLPAGEYASVPATANKNIRYLFAIPEFKKDGKNEADKLPAKDIQIVLHTKAKPKSVSVLGTGTSLVYQYLNGELTVELPANIRTELVDVVQVVLN